MINICDNELVLQVAKFYDIFHIHENRLIRRMRTYENNGEKERNVLQIEALIVAWPS